MVDETIINRIRRQSEQEHDQRVTQVATVLEKFSFNELAEVERFLEQAAENKYGMDNLIRDLANKPKDQAVVTEWDMRDLIRESNDLDKRNPELKAKAMRMQNVAEAMDTTLRYLKSDKSDI